ncbi:START domain containing 14 [Thalassophryne amazonica]|uniref:START domain containing 14 n=1 Tax=Thalassophryne amazonica TaxID=390379 RepID=UPI00147178DF|nr:START domain containing 14 [Thalassophryne amazonica]
MSRRYNIPPDDACFADFRNQCLSTEHWHNKYAKQGMEVWVEVPPASNKGTAAKLHRLKCKMTITDVPAATMYDVLLDGQYRETWDNAMLESYDIARVSPNADVGYYAWRCPSPLKNRDVVTLRSWRVVADEFLIINFSVNHPDYPPQNNFVRAVSVLTGYLLKSTGPNSCTFTYLSEADPKGYIPKWVVNTASRALAPRVLRSVHKAGQGYPQWKRQNAPDYKPWLHPEQSTVQIMDMAKLTQVDPAEPTLQRSYSLENCEDLTMDGQENEDSS